MIASRHLLAIQLIGLFLLTGYTRSAPFIDTKDAIAQAVAAASSSNTSPNVSVTLHSPVVVPAMQLPEAVILNASAATPIDANSAAAGTEPPRQALAPEVFNSGFALVNGTPVFLHASASGETFMEEVAQPTTTSPSVLDILNLTTLTPREALVKDSQSVAHSVMKAMEHLTNISKQQSAASLNTSISGAGAVNIHNSSAVVASATNTSSVSVVVVPLIQNAFDLSDDKNPSAAQLAANNPVVISEKNGTHTTLHVVVKRETSALLPISDHNAHGPLTDVDFLGGGLIASNTSIVNAASANISHTAAIIAALGSVSVPINASVIRPLENAHGPLTDADFTTTALPTAHLSTSKILLVQPANESSSSEMTHLTVGDLVTEHVTKPTENTSVMVNPTPVVPAEPTVHLANASMLLPSVLLPANVQIVEQAPVLRASSDAQAGPIFFFKVPTIDTNLLAARTAQETQPVHEAPAAADLAPELQLTTASSILNVNVSTLPSAPRVPLEIVEPIQIAKPLTSGTFAFVPIQDANNATEAKLLRMEV